MITKLDAAFIKAHRIDALSAQNGFCRYCLGPLTPREATADHRTPRARGGSNAKANIAAACRDCNMTKGMMDERLFQRLIAGPMAPTGLGIHLIAAWSRRRIWSAMHRACRRILKSAGAEYRGPSRSTRRGD